MRTRRPDRGFTLVELLVAMFVMAVLAGLAWQGVDGMLRTREATQAAMDRSLRLNTVLAQWEQDLAALHESAAAPPLQFDGRTLRLTRSTADGLQVVAWSVHDGSWWRWVSAPTLRARELGEHWLRSQQLQGQEPGQLRLMDDVGSWQLYFFRGNAWSNAQSSGDRVQRPGAAASAPGVAGATPLAREQLPTGVRLVINLPGGVLTRDLLVPPQPE